LIKKVAKKSSLHENCLKFSPHAQLNKLAAKFCENALIVMAQTVFSYLAPLRENFLTAFS
jgi:hypothetical protein